MQIRKRRPIWLRNTVSVLAVSASLGVGLYFRPSTYSTPYLFFFPSVLVALWFGGFGPGLLATGLTAVVVNRFFLSPLGGTSLDPVNLWRGIFFSLSFAIVCWMVDIRRIRAEARIERQLRLLDIAIEPIIVRDSSDNILFWNKGAERLYGWTKEEALGTCIHDLLRTVFPQPLQSIQRELVQKGSWQGELEHKRRDGSKVRVASSWTIELKDNKQTAVMESNFDLSERNRMESALRESERQFRDLANAIPQLCWVANPDGWISWYNQRWYEYTGTTPEQMEGWGWQSVHDPEVLPEVLARWKKTIELREPFEMIFPLRGADGLFRPFLTRVNPVFDDMGTLVRWFGTNTDISAQKSAEAALVRTEKLSALGRMAATIAHEVNNPLAAVMNSIYIAASDSTLAPETRKILEVADQELRRAAHITSQTLIFCRETGASTSLEIPKIVDEVLDVYDTKVKTRGISILRRQRCGLCRKQCDFCFWGNASELRQVISNLVGNAIDALNDDGVLHIRMCRYSGNDAKHYVRLTIADNGCGIRTENLKRVFEPFYTTKDSVGTGLGLWVTEQIVKKYGGSIRVRSKSNRGTVFAVAFPATTSQ